MGKGDSPRSDSRTLTADEQIGDAMFTGLRLTTGVDLDAVNRRYSTDVWQRYGSDLHPFVDLGILCREGAQLRLTRRGMLLANEVMAIFV